MTERLYYQDAYLAAFNAVITATSEQAVALDRTAFYPGGGGQPHDLGVLQAAGKPLLVTAVQTRSGDIWHQLDAPPPPVGFKVQGELDWKRRFALMRTHTAMHILCGVIWRDYGASVTGGNMEPLRGRMDFEFESMRAELVREIEEKINVEVAAARPVRVRILPRQEAFQIPDLIRTKINLLPEGIAE